MQEIVSVSAEYEEEAVDAVIKDNTIIPGKSGKKVNDRESYLRMNEFGSLNKLFLVFDKVKPNISLYDNLDKYIIKGNDSGSVSIIVDSNKYNEFFDKENISYFKVVLSNEEEIDINNSINGFNNEKDFNKLNRLYKKNKIKYPICISDYSNINLCLKNKYFLVRPSLYVSKNNIGSFKSSISGGDIVFLSSSLSLSEVKYIINTIKYFKYSIVKLDSFIKE